jgi:acetyl-CoA carboxylase biotin carboxylase subunit
VTELVTGLDLVALQIRIAEGEPLPEGIEDREPHGHAIEVRLYAEDPYQNFAPSPGRIERLRLPEGPGVRNDCGVYEGAEVSIHYDPMLGKLIVWAADREKAIARLSRALAELRIEGIRTNVPFYRALLADPDVRAGRLDIAMLDRKLHAGELRPRGGDVPADLPLLAAALAHFESAGKTVASPPVAGGGRRARWGAVARREALRGGGWS